jgi:hypothetical protein
MTRTKGLRFGDILFDLNSSLKAYIEERLTLAFVIRYLSPFWSSKQQAEHTDAAMRSARYSTSRQKACQPCSNAKTKCDQKADGCARCARRGLYCTYPQAFSSAVSSRGSGGDKSNDADLRSPFSAPDPLSVSASPLSTPDCQLLARGHTDLVIVESQQAMNNRTPTNNFSITASKDHSPNGPFLNTATTHLPDNFELLDFSRLDLICPINVNEIRNRWLNAYIPIPGQTPKEYSARITAFIYRILKSYAAVAVHDRGIPPFVHSSQVTALASSPPLSACFSLIRICEKPLPGSERVAADVLQRAMDSIYREHGTYDGLALLAAFQAYLIYTMVLFFQLNQGTDAFFRQAMMNLQELACVSSRRGLVCAAEQQRARPTWESWIVAESKRRTLYTMYLFDGVLSAQEGLPTFLGIELQGLPAPANKAMWGAQARYDWGKVYNVYLAEWMHGGLCIDELWPVPTHLDEPGLNVRRSRVDEWLQTVDEFGTMLYAVTSGTHGS